MIDITFFFFLICIDFTARYKINSLPQDKKEICGTDIDLGDMRGSRGGDRGSGPPLNNHKGALTRYGKLSTALPKHHANGDTSMVTEIVNLCPIV